MSKITRLPGAATPDKREERLRKQRERARARRKAELQQPFYIVSAMIVPWLGGLAWSGENDNRCLCPKCKNVIGTYRGGRQDECAVCRAPKSRRWY
jgi:hypothetical protein